MIGILLIFFIGKYYYKLAETFNKNKWLFAILGVITYYVGTFTGGLLLGVLDELMGLNFDWDNTLLLTLVALPFGIGSAYLFYYILNKKWKNEYVEPQSEIQDIGREIDGTEKSN